MNSLDKILVKLPIEIGEQIKSLPNHIKRNLEEIRIRNGNHIIFYASGKEYELELKNGSGIDNYIINNIFNSFLNYSAYAYQEELTNGYITIEGGHRVGICGRTVMENGRVKTIKDISSINIRRSKEIIGVSDPCVGYLMKGRHLIYNTLIHIPAQMRKNHSSSGSDPEFQQHGVSGGLCDERSEISGMYNGKSSYDLGPRTDILDGCPKEKGMIMLIRSMSPDLIATDEIGKKEDCHAIEAAVCAGISLLTTIMEAAMRMSSNQELASWCRRVVFERLIFLTNIPAIGSISAIRDWRNPNVV
jgi:stage III sporulation protein AA